MIKISFYEQCQNISVLVKIRQFDKTAKTTLAFNHQTWLFLSRKQKTLYILHMDNIYQYITKICACIYIYICVCVCVCLCNHNAPKIAYHNKIFIRAIHLKSSYRIRQFSAKSRTSFVLNIIFYSSKFLI